jgi:uncharacterized membrane protein (UPF0127 family)
MRNRFTIIFCVAILFLSTLVTLYIHTPDPYLHGKVMISAVSFDALISDTEALRAQGLSDRPSLEKDEVMLFIFPNPGFWGFWMKDMRFPIDMLWVNSEFKIVSFESNVSPSTYPKIFFPTGEALYVIELPAGTLSDIGAHAGDTVSVSR